MGDDDEVLDLVDKNDKVIGTILRTQKIKLTGRNAGYLRAAEILIRNKEGQLWIPRRSMKKAIAPGGLDYSASGHVASGESYLQTAIRETEEELNLKVDLKFLKPLYKFPPIGDEKLFFRTVYIYESDEAPDYNSDDFSGYDWLTPEELLKKLRNGEPAKRSLAETITYLVEHSL